jgi:hypothetical protein
LLLPEPTDWPWFLTKTGLKILPARLNAVRTGKHLLKPDKYKDVIIESLKFLVKEKWVEVNAFTLMSNHIHLIWQIQSGDYYYGKQCGLIKIEFLL